jgi:hypothetical protein
MRFVVMEASLAVGTVTTVRAPARAAPLYPGASRLLGSARELRRDRIGAFERAMRERGDVVRFVVGPPGRRFEIYGVFHPDGVQQVLPGTRGRYSKATRFLRELADALG